ncbi:site-specific integrase [Thioclava electrotropha]|uniref:Site-specific integrase n=1 Tax=Thioclava electrotropha TaxID=1549850 RepID=A0ABX6YPD8_9RHOB|nr:site-specific integrase [Thioclava electrotropha]QPZ89692.1 site-specific integrase [Thioclava electrotropha]
MPKLTKRVVETLPVLERDYISFDSEVNGFGVRVLPSGRRSYLVQYRSGGRTRRIAIGQHGAITVDEARRKARELLGSVAAGKNPAEVIAQHRGAPTLSSVGERFLHEHVAVHCKPSTAREYRRALELFAYPAMGNHKIIDVNRADIAKLHHANRARPYQANRTLGVLSKLFTLCEVWGLRPDGSNPCRHVPKYREEKRERFLSKIELLRLGETLTACEAEGTETVFVVAAFRLLILTGCRLSEIQTLKWSFVSGRYLELPDSKTGARRIPLPPAAQAVLERLPRRDGNPFVIAGALAGQRVTDLQKPWRRIRKSAGLEDVRIHDLRHTYASNAVANGMPIQMVGKLLGHTQIQTTMRYAHLADDPVMQAAERNAAMLSGAMNGA